MESNFGVKIYKTMFYSFRYVHLKCLMFLRKDLEFLKFDEHLKGFYFPHDITKRRKIKKNIFLNFKTLLLHCVETTTLNLLFMKIMIK